MVSSRLGQYIDYKGISYYSIENKLEVSRGSISKAVKNKGNIGSNVLENILMLYSDLNAEWLLTGKGDMLKANVTDKPKHILSEVNRQENETRPRIPMDAAAGSLSTTLDGVVNNDCEQLPVIKAFARYDFTIFTRGNSMFPEYHSGDELACLFIKNTSFVQWGRVHVLDTAQGVILKRIFDNGEHILCRSLNPDYSDFTIHKSEVYNIALVIGLIRRY